MSRNPCKHCEKRIHHRCTARSNDRATCKYSLSAIFDNTENEVKASIGVD